MGEIVAQSLQVEFHVNAKNKLKEINELYLLKSTNPSGYTLVEFCSAPIEFSPGPLGRTFGWGELEARNRNLAGVSAYAN